MTDPSGEDHRAELPAHPEGGHASGEGRATPVNWPMVVVLGLIGALLVVIVVLHLIGVVGPASHP